MRVAILTAIKEFNSSYSLVSVVQGQAEALVRHGHDVKLFVCESLKPEQWEWCNISLREDLTVLNIVPEIPDRVCYVKTADLTEAHRALSESMSKRIFHHLMNCDVVFTHDLIFTGWNLPYAMTVADLSFAFSEVPFYHWLHSLPGNRFDWWDLDIYGNNSTLVYPTATDLDRVADRFKTDVSRTMNIPHIVDLRIFWEFREDTCVFISDHPQIMSADFVQVFPASSERLRGKGLDRIINLFAELKRRGASVCLICANQHTNPQNRIENLDWYEGIADRNDLRREFIFTSRWQGGIYEHGVPRGILRELMMCSDFFLNPTIAESFGLGLPEASLSGAVVPIQNLSLENQAEVSGGIGAFVKMGSWQAPWQPRNEGQFFNSLADMTLDEMSKNSGALLKAHYRKTYNMDAVYDRYYRTILQGSP